MGIKFVPVCDKCGYNFEVTYTPRTAQNFWIDNCFSPCICPHCGETIDTISFIDRPSSSTSFTLLADGELVTNKEE